MKLYELTDNRLQILNRIDDEDGDMEALRDTLDSIDCAIEVMALNIAIFTQSLALDVGALKAEEQRLGARRKTIEAKEKWLKEYLKSNMEKIGKETIKTPTHSISIQNNPPALYITDEDLIPGKYMVLIPQRWEVDKKAVKDALKNGEVPGAELVQGRSLRIR